MLIQIIEVLKDLDVAFAISLILIITGALRKWFKLEFMLAFGISLFLVSGPLLVYQKLSEKSGLQQKQEVVGKSLHK